MASEKKQAVSGPKSFTVRLDGGPNEQAYVRAHLTAKGATSFVMIERGTKDARTREKGCTTMHADLTEATKAAEAVAKRMAAAGWRVRPSRGFGQRKPDSFDLKTLPTPAKK